MTSILDAPREVLDQFLAETNQTEEQLRERLAKMKRLAEQAQDSGPMTGVNPDLADKFTSPVAYDLIK